MTPLSVLVVLLSACTSEAPPPPEAAVELVHPLAQAPSVPWVQTVLFVGAPGEQVEDLVLASGPEEPVVTLVDRAGQRRALRLSEDGSAREAQVTLRPDADARRSDSRGAQRVRLEETEDSVSVVLSRTDGAGSTVALRDRADRRLAFPSAGTDGAYFAELGELGGVWHATADGVTRVVPERGATRPVAWPAADGSRVVYVQQGDPPQVVVAQRVEAPLLEAEEALQGVAVPGLLTAVQPLSEEAFVRLSGCGTGGTLGLEMGEDGRVRLGELLPVPVERALACGEGCVQLLGTSDAGAPRVLATLTRGAHGAWRLWRAPDGSGVHPPAWWMSSPAAAELPEVRSCLGTPEPSQWLLRPLARAPAGTRLTHVEVEGDLLQAHGTGPKGRFILTVTDDALPVGQPVLRERTPPGDVLTLADGGSLAVVDRAVVRTPAGGSPQVIVPASDDADPHEPALDATGRVLWLADRGSEPGLARLDLEAGSGALVVHGAGFHAPTPARRAGRDVVAWVREVDGTWWVGVAEPVDAPTRRAWDVGPLPLLGLERAWVPVQRVPGQGFVRCEGGAEITLGLEDGGAGVITWAGSPLAVRAMVDRGGRLSFLADREGTPTVVAELHPSGQVAAWWPRVDRVRGATAWQPASSAKPGLGVGRCEAR